MTHMTRWTTRLLLGVLIAANAALGFALARELQAQDRTGMVCTQGGNCHCHAPGAHLCNAFGTFALCQINSQCS